MWSAHPARKKGMATGWCHGQIHKKIFTRREEELSFQGQRVVNIILFCVELAARKARRLQGQVDSLELAHAIHPCTVR